MLRLWICSRLHRDVYLCLLLCSFGLVLLEAMQRLTPWAARHGSGAAKLVNANGQNSTPLGFTYANDAQLTEYMKTFSVFEIKDQIVDAHNYFNENHTIRETCDAIEAILEKEKKINVNR